MYLRCWHKQGAMADCRLAAVAFGCCKSFWHPRGHLKYTGTVVNRNNPKKISGPLSIKSQTEK
jgi:hypothetical protein